MIVQKDETTYGEVFAMIIVIVIVLVVTYITLEYLYQLVRVQDQLNEPNETRQIIIEGLPEEYKDGTVLYENLTDEEADKLLEILLEEYEETEEELRILEKQVEN